MCRARTSHPVFTRMMGKNCASARRPSNAPYTVRYEQRALGRTANIAGSWSAAIRCSDDQGRYDRWYATAFDIEDRKRADGSLLAGEKRLLEMVGSGFALTES